MRRLRPEDYLAMSAWDMDERVYKYLLGSACKAPEEPLAWLPKKDPTSKINILMLVKENTGSAKVMQKLGMVYDRSSSYTKSDGSKTFESDIYVLKMGEK